MSGYTNIIHPDKAERDKRVGYLKEIIRNARHFGTPYVISETGTYNTESDWVHHPKNKTEEGFEECRKVIADLAQTAYDHGAVFLLETYVNNVVGSVEETVKMFAQVDHPGLGLLMDPTNYFETHNIDAMDKILEPGLRHADRQDQDRPRQGREALGRRQVGEACRHRRRRTRWRATPSAASARSSCRRRASARSTTTSTSSGSPRSTRTSRSSSST